MKYTYDPVGDTPATKPQPGLVGLRKAVAEIYGLGNYGILSVRKIRGGEKMSIHSEGRALDIKCDARIESEKELGDRVAKELWENREKLGIQKIIWNKRVVDFYNPEWKEYEGEVSHVNHLHVEMCWDMAKALRSKMIKEILGYN